MILERTPWPYLLQSGPKLEIDTYSAIVLSTSESKLLASLSILYTPYLVDLYMWIVLISTE